MARTFWTEADTNEALRILGKHRELAPALAEVSGALGRTITRDSLDHRLKLVERGTANGNLGALMPKAPLPSPMKAAPVNDSVNSGHDRFATLTALAKKWGKKGGLSLEAVCDEMDISPTRARQLIEDAQEAGYNLEIHHGFLELRTPAPSSHEVAVTDAPDMPGEEIVWGVVSDPHIGSKHHNGDALKRHVEYLVSQGVKHIIGPGDWVPGGYRFLKYEVLRTGIEDQCEMAKETIQSFGRELVWHSIAGNHDESFDVGIDASKMIQRMMVEDGWTNFRHYGARGARLLLNGTKVELHHPGGGLGYAHSYKIQRHVDNTAPDQRAEVLFTGHTHQALHLKRGGTHAFLCGTFENGDSGFGRMIGGDVQLGGWLVRFVRNERGIQRLSAEFCEYPQKRMAYVKAG